MPCRGWYSVPVGRASDGRSGSWQALVAGGELTPFPHLMGFSRGFGLQNTKLGRAVATASCNTMASDL